MLTLFSPPALQILCCVADDGECFLFDLGGELLRQFNLFGQVSVTGSDDTSRATIAETMDNGSPPGRGGLLIQCQIVAEVAAPVSPGSSSPAEANGPVRGAGVVVGLTSDYQLIAASGPLLDAGATKPRPLHPTGLEEPPTAWAVLQPAHTLSRSVEVLISSTSGSVWLCDASGCQDLLVSNGPFTRMSIAPNGKLLASFSADGKLLVTNLDFTEQLSEFDAQTKKAPLQMCWCGADAVTLHWSEVLLIVGPYNDWVKHPYDPGPLFLLPECDGVRILTNSKLEFLQKVPESTEAVFKIGSSSPPAILFDAFDHFKRLSPKADENIRSIANELPVAVSACIDAAMHETDRRLQRQLLGAASFGKAFVEFADPSEFVDACRAIRVLNALRHYDVGIPMTISQLRQQGQGGGGYAGGQNVTSAATLAAGYDLMVDMLMVRHEHLLALRIAHYLPGLRTEPILVHWACAKVRTRATQMADAELAHIVVSKLRESGTGISYADIAETAWKARRPELATRLLEYEPKAAAQVPLLLDMQEDAIALQKAIESGDTDLVYHVVMFIKGHHNPADFFRLIRSRPEALALLISYCRDQNHRLLKDIFFHFQLPEETANVVALDALRTGGNDPSSSSSSASPSSSQSPQSGPVSDPIPGLHEALTLFNEAKGIAHSQADEGRPEDLAALEAVTGSARMSPKEREQNASFAARATEEQIRLLMLQKDLEASLPPDQMARTGGVSFLGASVSETLYGLTMCGQHKRAARVKSDFKVPDKRYWWIRLRALADSHDWPGLERLSKEKKSPIGYEPFAEAVIDARAIRELPKYIPKIPDPMKKAELWLQAGSGQEALAVADALWNGGRGKHDQMLAAGQIAENVRDACAKIPHQRQVAQAANQLVGDISAALQ
jgi:vacuolar protein sorting-associated protein 16